MLLFTKLILFTNSTCKKVPFCNWLADTDRQDCTPMRIANFFWCAANCSQNAKACSCLDADVRHSEGAPRPPGASRKKRSRCTNFVQRLYLQVSRTWLQLPPLAPGLYAPLDELHCRSLTPSLPGRRISILAWLHHPLVESCPPAKSACGRRTLFIGGSRYERSRL